MGKVDPIFKALIVLALIARLFVLLSRVLAVSNHCRVGRRELAS